MPDGPVIVFCSSIIRQTIGEQATPKTGRRELICDLYTSQILQVTARIVFVYCRIEYKLER